MERMKASTHTHIEDIFDAVTDMHVSVKSYIKRGTIRVATTGHGTFLEYESFRDVVTAAKEWAKEAEAALPATLEKLGYPSFITQVYDENNKQYGVNARGITKFVSRDKIDDLLESKINETNIFGHYSEDPQDLVDCYILARIIARIKTFDIVPGVETYFEDDARHMVLIAKNEEGYREISRILSDSNREDGKIITTMDMLKQYVTKGNVVCTSACIGGVFAKPILSYSRDAEKIEIEKAELAEAGFWDAQKIEDEYITIPQYELSLKPAVTKKAIANAERDAKKGIHPALPAILEIQRQENLDAKDYAKRKEEEYKTKTVEVGNETILASTVIKNNKKKYNNYLSLVEKYKENSKEELYTKTMEQNKSLYLELASIFGEDNIYFEIQNHNLEMEKEPYAEVLRLAESLGKLDKVLATNDIHLGVTGENEEELRREVIRRNMAGLARYGTYSPIEEDAPEYCIKSDNDIAEGVKEIIEYSGVKKDEAAKELSELAVNNQFNILKECDFTISKNIKHYPQFCEDENAEFDRLVEIGIKEKFPDGLPDEYRARLDYEKNVIKEMGYASYHLIVQDYIMYGRLLGYCNDEQIESAPLNLEEMKAYVDDLEAKGELKKIGIGIGPGRGSAAGSLVCFALGITNVDPIKNGLLFERFLNVERVSMPDIDVDFKSNIREKCYQYVINKFGEENVSKISTKSYSKGSGAIRATGRYLLVEDLYMNNIDEKKQPEVAKAKKQIFYKAVDELASEYSKLNAINYGSDEDIFSKLRLSAENDELKKKILDYTEITIGTFTAIGQHAAGVIISKDRIKDISPLMYNKKLKSYQIQCEMARAEEYGLLKMDFLGLKNLDIITDIVKNPSNGLEPLDIMQTQKGLLKVLEDKDVYKNIFATGMTQGVFQFESDGMKKMLKEFEPENFDDIILLVAAYRPGPLDYIPEIVQWKWYNKDIEEYKKRYNTTEPPKKSITLDNPALNAILAPTYGCPIYQEQIMKIFQDMAGYSLGGADVVRRYMSKKKVDKLAFEKKTFIYGDPERGIPGAMAKQGITEKEADDLFEQMMPFAKYGFNKSHAAAYAVVAVQTAYLKEHRKLDFYRASMDMIDDVDGLAPYYKEAEEYGITILPPSMDSQNKFSVIDDHTILRGFSSVKGLGDIPKIECKTSCAETFLRENKNIPVGTVITMASLGLFETTWAMETPEQEEYAKSYISGNNAYIATFIDNYGEYLTKNEGTEKGIAAVEEGKSKFLNDLDHSNGSTLDFSTSKATKKYATKESLLGKFATKNTKEMLEYVAVLKICAEEKGNSRVLEELDTLPEDAQGIEMPVIVESCEEAETQKGTKFLRIKIVDLEGNTAERRIYKKKWEKEMPTVPLKTPIIMSVPKQEIAFRNSAQVKEVLNAPSKEKISSYMEEERQSQYGKTIEDVMSMLFESEIEKEVVYCDNDYELED